MSSTATEQLRLARRLAVAAIGAAVWLGSPAAARALTITEFSAGISEQAAPVGIAIGPDGNAWFTEGGAGRIGRITPAGGVSEFSTPSADTELGEITAGGDGSLWFTEESANRIGRITPYGAATEFSEGITPEAGVDAIAAGPDGNLWFTERDRNQIGRISPDGAVSEFASGITGSGLEDITPGPDGNLWFTERDSDRIGRITPAGLVTQHAGLTPGSGPSGITAGPDGNLWFTEADGNRIGRITPSGAVTEFSLGLSAGGLADIAAGPDGNLWFTATSANRIGRITPNGKVTEFVAGLSPGSVPLGIAGDKETGVWFTDVVGDRIGRALIEAPRLTAGGVKHVTSSQATLTGLVDARNDPTAYFFEYGETDAYGAITAVQDAGAGASDAQATALISGLKPETTYRYRLVATNAGGARSTGPDRTFATAAEPDRDRDGAIAPEDCDDDDPALHPGAFDRPQNGVDEDCDGQDARYPLLYPPITDRWLAGATFTRVVELAVRRLPAGATVTLRCRGRGCPVKQKRWRARKPGAVVRLTRLFSGRRLRPGTRLELRVSAPLAVGRVALYTVRRRHTPTRSNQCVAPGATRPHRCPAM